MLCGLALAWLLVADRGVAEESALLADSPAGRIRLEPGVFMGVTGASGEILRFAFGPARGAAPASALRVIVDQLSSDAALRLVRADLELRADQPMGYREPELVLLPAGAGAAGAGAWHLDVEVISGGDFRVGVEVASADEARLPGDVAWTEGTDLFARGGDERRAARGVFERAAAAWLEAGLERDAARALLVAGNLAAEGGDSDAGLELLGRALELRRAAGDLYGAGEAWHLIGHARRQRGELDSARSALERSLELARQVRDERAQARALLNLGFVEQQAGDAEAALGRYEPALELARRAGDAGLESAVLNNLAGLDFEAGRLARAVERFEALQGLEERRGEKRGRARVLVNLAAAQRALGRFQAALDAYDDALDFLGGSDPRLEATVLNNLGFTYLRLGEPTRAEDRLLAALPLRRAAGDPRGEAVTLNNLGLAAMARGEWDLAAERFGAALALRREVDDARGQATTLHHLGRLELARDRPSAARDPLEWALLARRELGDEARAASSAAELAKVYARLGRPEDALELASEAAGELRRFGDRDAEIDALLTRVRLLRALGRDGEALADARRAAELVESLRLEVRSPDLRASLFAVERGLYEEAVDLLVERPGDAAASAAFEMAERARGRSLLDVLHGVGEARLPAAVRAEHRRLVEELAEVRYRMGRERRRGREPSPELEARRRRLAIELDRLEHGAPGEEASRASGPSPELLDLPGLQRLLGRETLALVFFLGEGRSFLWRVDEGRAEVHVLPGRAVLEDHVAQVQDDLSTFDPRAHGDELARARRLSTMLLGDLRESLENGRFTRLAVVAEGRLLALPLAALPLPDGPDGAESSGTTAEERLIDRFEVVSLPSPSALPVLRRLASSPPAPGGLALVADPLYAPPRVAAASAAGGERGSAHQTGEDRPTYAALPGSRREAEALRDLLAARGDRGEAWVGARARREAVLGRALEPFRVVHFATHGVVDDRRPELSALVLSLFDSTGAAVDGHLRLRDVYEMSLAADLVVLSGCQTALGRQVRGEGLLGLTRGFFVAGAARVLASLWRVEDAATATLMARFYGGLLEDGLEPSAALRRAQLATRAERAHRDPYFWAAFVIQGDWTRR